MKEKLINQESKTITTRLLFHVTEPDSAAGPPADAWQATEFFFGGCNYSKFLMFFSS